MPELRPLGSYIRILIAVLAMLDVASPADARPVVRASVSRPRIYVANSHCRGHAYRPENITLACRYYNVFATEVHFFEEPPSEVYGSPEAGASATIHENVCRPSCSSRRFFSDKGALTLTRIVRCEDGLLYYSQADYAFQEGQGKVDIAPRERCSLVRTGA